MVRKYTDKELRKASNHLFYEIWMMNQLAEILEAKSRGIYVSRPEAYTNVPAVSIRSTGIMKASETNSKEDETRLIINNAIIEAFAIHVRALMDFFYTSVRNDDIVAEHFFSSPSQWINSRPKITQERIKKIKTRVNKEVAHLTYGRQKVKSKIWPFQKLRNNLNRVVDRFVAQAPKSLLGSRWK